MMYRLRFKLAIFNIMSKLIVTALFVIVMPWIAQRIALIETDRDLIRKREQVIGLISRLGIEPFIYPDSSSSFGSYNILKEEFISLETTKRTEDVNIIEESARIIDNEEIQYRVLSYSLEIDGIRYILSVGRSLTSIQSTYRTVKIMMIIFLVLIITLTFITDLQYTRRLLKPLDAITRKLKVISDPSSFDRSPVKTTTSDFVSLDRALKEMMDNIEQLFNKEKEATINISHELLTPVSVLRSKLETLINQDNITPDVSEKIGESLKTLQRLQLLVNSLLMIARLESRQYIKDENVHLNDLLNDIADEIRPVAIDAQVDIRDEKGPETLLAGVNSSLLFSMFFNILNNAVNNTPPGGVITIRTVKTASLLKVEISDTGRGMTPEQLGSLFSRFKASGSGRGSGAGIGLAIAKSIADFHNIAINVDSQPEKGSIFSFIFH